MNACEKRLEELSAAQPSAEQQAPERDARGRFAAGNSGGPGNPFGRYTAKLREALVGAVTEEDMQAIVRKMIDMARVGSIPAMRLIMQYVIGKPTVAPNPDRVQMDEWNIFQESAAMTDDVAKVVKSLEPEACLELAREIRPIMSDVAMQQYAKAFEEMSAVAPARASPPSSGFDGAAVADGDEPHRDNEVPGGFDGGTMAAVCPTACAESPPDGFDGGAARAKQSGANGRYVELLAALAGSRGVCERET